MHDRKARLGEAHRFIWSAPQPLEGVPSLSLSGVTQALEPIHAPAIVAAVLDQRTLSIPALTLDGARGAAGLYGAAWLITERDGAFPVHIAAVSDGFATLAEPLSRRVEGAAKLQWATWSVILAEALTAELRRNIPWEVAYTVKAGEDIFSRPNRADGGLFHVVRAPFSTGLTTAQLTARFSDVVNQQRPGRQGFEDEIGDELEILIGHLRAQLTGRGLTEDDIRAGAVFLPAHAHLTAARIFEPGNPERALNLRRRGLALAGEALQALPWLDINGDGVPDEGEVGASSEEVYTPGGQRGGLSPIAPRFGADRVP
ncbi:hypothetical protein KKB55_11060 [Myxococcota bacterium]|nr:hypothetical protein [Myxococcota bacterium]MBU1898276.1 hypothetical protein [Myxococcota bacterium]